MRVKQTALRFWAKINNYPKQYTVPVSAFIILVFTYGVIFFTEKPVIFTYAGSSCVKQLTLFPDIHKTSSTDYKVETAHSLKVGNFTLATQFMCFTALKAPKEGVVVISTSPFGGWLLRKNFSIMVGVPPVVSTGLLDKPVPVSKPLVLPMSTTDKVFSYFVKANEQQVKCTPGDKAISCDLQQLKLLQGKPYELELERHFNNRKMTTVLKKNITTLSATRVVDVSTKPGEVVYAKLKIIDAVLDKKTVKVTASLFKIDGDKRTAVNVTSKITDQQLQVTIVDELPRSATYELIIDKLEAIDGSGLEAPYVLPFTTSGGPKVTGINIGSTGVAMGATAIVTFDQTLSEKQDISKIVTTSGGAVLSLKRGNQVLVSLAGVPKCGDFSIKISNDIQSNYEIAGNSAWSYSGRTICHTIGTIGYSSKGRAINAYYFGSGPAVVVYTGAIHGNEVGTKYLMERWISDLEANARNIPANKSVIVVPQINPDGVASGSRTNGRNVDLNRNFATSDWQKDITTVNNQPFPGGGGESPMSEPETNAIASLVQRTRPVLVLSYHSVGSLLAANQAGPSGVLAGTYSQLSGYRNTTGQTGGTFEYSISGTADDWYAEKIGVPSILIELGSHTTHQFSRNQKAMWAMLNNS